MWGYPVDFITSVLGNTTTIMITVAGWIVLWLMTRDKRRTERMRALIARLEYEVNARMAGEREACSWLADETGRTTNSVIRELRDRAETLTGLRPRMTPRDMAPHIDSLPSREGGD